MFGSIRSALSWSLSSISSGLCGLIGLAALVAAWYPVANKDLVNVFLERWHQETSSFYLPVGEMTITLDDVFCLLHLLVRDRSIDHVPSTFDRDTVKILLMTHLGILPEIRLQRRQAQVLGWSWRCWHRVFGLPWLICCTWSAIRYLSTSPRVTFMLPTSSTSTTSTLAMSMHVE